MNGTFKDLPSNEVSFLLGTIAHGFRLGSLKSANTYTED